MRQNNSWNQSGLVAGRVGRGKTVERREKKEEKGRKKGSNSESLNKGRRLQI